ncbi:MULTISPECIES: glutamate-cysteine ligase family protein [Halobacterium]|uniref:glutamate-cysteine ligase family protein n=1 Tax=Halobacterium TaxID=2239 RepID=UPI00073E727F|nr:glutamate-cysteine ligase family protein [Halobacterium sp. CBA1132]MCG1002558.1 glutamate-cysteine ligase family protein [Halobacterium noricense]
MSARESEPIRRSIEVEYWVVDGDGRLTEPGALVDVEGAEREFVEPVLEVKTTPCETTAELRATLLDRLRAVLRRADDAGKRLVPLATPVNHDEIAERTSDRTRIQSRAIGERFDYVRPCAGTHVHVEQQPGHEVAQFNALVALDPALALVNSSPYFRGERVAAGARSKCYRRLAYDGLPEQGELWPYVEDTADWEDRLDRRYEEFVAAAVDAGVDRDTVESTFDPENAVWTPVKFREEFGTVEWRAPDTALPSQVLRLADDVVGVVERVRENGFRVGDDGRVTDRGVVAPTFDTVREYVDAAISDGLDSPAVSAYLERMGFDVDAYDPLTHELDERGDASRERARALRLEHADRLERDVRRAQSACGD